MLLLKRLFQRFPLLTAVWLAIPVMSGLVILPLAAAERQLIDKAAAVSGEGLAAVAEAAWPPLLLLAAAAVCAALLGFVRKLTDDGMAGRASMHFHGEVQRCATSVPLEKLEHAGYYDRLSRAQLAADGELTGLLRNAGEVAHITSLFAGMLGVVWKGHPAAALLLAAVCLAVLIQRLRIEIRVKQANRQMTTEGRMADYLKHSLAEPSVLKELKLFGASGWMIGMWDRSMTEATVRRNGFRRQENKMSAWFIVAFILAALAALALLLGRLEAGTVTAGTAAVVFQTVWQAQSVPMRLSWAFSKLYVQRTKAADLNAFLSEPTEERVAKPDFPEERITSVRFDNVTFRYPGADRPVLSGINVTLTAGQATALVGENGAGKSTFVHLLLGLYEPTEGRIWLNAHDRSRYNARSVWERMSAVFQEAGRYPITAREYVAAGKPAGVSGDEARIAGALQLCGLQSVFAKGAALDQTLTSGAEGGRDLSGGQWQRLSVARAAYRRSDIVVLDEPTSAIDPDGELALYKSCKEMAGGKLALFVSHRLGWARFADRIIVLHEGRVAEEGAHDQLMQRGGLYAASFRSQSAWYGSGS